MTCRLAKTNHETLTLLGASKASAGVVAIAAASAKGAAEEPRLTRAAKTIAMILIKQWLLISLIEHLQDELLFN